MNTKFTYVYLLTSIMNSNRHYTGFTTHLGQRLKSHNAGKVTSTKRWRPWQIETVTAFRDRAKATAFEKYLKSHSGRAFASKRF